MDDSEITNPLAKRLHAKKDAEDVQTGKTLLEKDFISKGKAAAPDQLREIDSKLARYVQDYNAQRPAKAPLLRHVPNRVYADMKFAANFELMPRLEDSHLRVTVGLHSAAAVMMAEVARSADERSGGSKLTWMTEASLGVTGRGEGTTILR